MGSLDTPVGGRPLGGTARRPSVRAAAASVSASGKARSLDSAPLITYFAALSITIVRLPILFGAKQILDPLILVLLAAAVTWGAIHQPRGSFINRTSVLALAYALLISIALFRGAHAGAYGTFQTAVNQSLLYVLFVVFGVVLVTTTRSRAEQDRRLLAIALAPGIYVGVNALASLGGLHGTEVLGNAITVGKPATLLHYLGIAAVRTKFALATSINLFSIVAAASLASVLIMRLRAPNVLSRRVTWLLAAAALYCILLGDSRGALVIALVVAAVLIWRAHSLPGWTVALAVPLLPLFVLGVTAAIHFLGADAALSRGSGLGGVETATGRVLIWERSWEVLKHLDIHQLYGWGAGGHFTSGASFRYIFSFPYVPEAPKAIFTHNALLQTLFDMGLAGLVVFMSALWSTWRRLQLYAAATGKSPALALLAILLVIVLSGASEVSPTYYSQEALLATLLIMGAAGGLVSSSRRIATDESSHPG